MHRHQPLLGQEAKACRNGMETRLAARGHLVREGEAMLRAELCPVAALLLRKYEDEALHERSEALQRVHQDGSPP